MTTERELLPCPKWPKGCLCESPRYCVDHAAPQPAPAPAPSTLSDAECDAIADKVVPNRDVNLPHYRALIRAGRAPAPSAVVDALRKLCFAARTSGGTAGPDAGLMAACDKAEQVLAALAAQEDGK